MSLADQLYQLELSLIAADTANHKHLDALLSDDFIEIGSSGRSYNKPQTLSLVQKRLRQDTGITDFKLKELTPDTILVTYKTHHGHQQHTKTLRSSLWIKTGENWKIIFHQGTPMAEAP